MSSRAVELSFFWFAAGALIYVYLGYPLLVRLLAAAAGRPVRADNRHSPSVTIVITAYNEEKSIGAKIANVQDFDYPRGTLEIIVASDGSTDNTDAIVKTCAFDGVRLLRVEGRVGKTACQNAAVEQAKGEIVVFTDATTRVDRRALLTMTANFADSDVGCVAGLLVYQAKGGGQTAAGGMSYWNYEVGLRAAESRLETLIGVSGCLYAVRRSAYRPISPNLISDFA